LVGGGLPQTNRPPIGGAGGGRARPERRGQALRGVRGSDRSPLGRVLDGGRRPRLR
jgi:hypothetical protein